MNDEVKFSGWLREHLSGISQRVENTVGPGTPDFCYCHNGRVVWIETKMFIKGVVLLRKEQYAWGMRWGRAGAPVFVIASDGLDVALWDYRKGIDIVVKGEYLAITSAPKWFQMSEVNRLESWLY